ncbi:MAG: hypothetical protein L0H41_08715 [Microlunatus sp.]|nr:hypothetical protein [Microlunatus sp.]
MLVAVGQRSAVDQELAKELHGGGAAAGPAGGSVERFVMNWHPGVKHVEQDCSACCAAGLAKPVECSAWVASLGQRQKEPRQLVDTCRIGTLAQLVDLAEELAPDATMWPDPEGESVVAAAFAV